VTYEYDDSDNRKRVVENNGSASTDYRYCHDARNQLTGRGSTAACDTSSVESFAYDDAGNRTQAVEAGTTRNFAYTADGLLCDQETGAAASCTGGNITSDDAGRISDQAGWHYLYDANARLVSACEDADCVGSGFDRLDFAYDGEGHRTGVTETPAAGSPIVEWTFRYQGDAVVAEYKDGTLYREYVTDDMGTISKVIVPAGQTGTGSYLVTWNGHGDAMALYRIESSGSLTLANSFAYGTWGKPTTATHNSIADLGFRFLYVGQWDVQWDSAYGLDLTYMHARHYSPNLGRFLQPDPSRLDEQLFVYVGNSPVTSVDPSGLYRLGGFDLYDAILRRMWAEMVANSAFTSRLPNPQLLPQNAWVWGFFGISVRPGGPWDHKPMLRLLAGVCADCRFYTPIRGYDRRYWVRFDVWSNIHYGYVGRAIGFSTVSLLTSARLAGALLGGHNHPADDLSIEIGMRLWRKYRFAITQRRMQAEIVAAMPLFRRLGVVKFVNF
jgi:RHS repeat-associated protein